MRKVIERIETKVRSVIGANVNKVYSHDTSS